MKLKLKKVAIEEKNVSAECLMAVDAFRRLIKYESKVRKTAEELDKWLELVPDEDMEAYVDYTTQLVIKNI